MTAMAGPSWEDLRKQARLLENDIDVKLVAFSKLGVSPSTSGLSGESAPLINSDDMFDTMSMELQQLLVKTSARVSARREREELLGGNSPPPSAVSGLNRRDQYAKESGHLHRVHKDDGAGEREELLGGNSPPPPSLVSGLNRRDQYAKESGHLHRYYQQEFTKTSARVSARREREELLGGNSPPPSAVSGLNRRDHYAKESGHLHRCYQQEFTKTSARVSARREREGTGLRRPQSQDSTDATSTLRSLDTCTARVHKDVGAGEREELVGGNSNPPPTAVSGLNRRDQYAKESGHLH
ncbi:Golgi SNAP receptor complex member 1, partial [Operophtera brumata]